MNDNQPSRILGMFGHIADALHSSGSKSIAQFTKDQRITPRVAVDTALVNNPLLVDTLHTLNGIFSAYIMQSAVRKLNVNNIRTNRLLHSLSTDRTKMGSGILGAGTLGEIAASMEDFHGGLPTGGVVQNDNPFAVGLRVAREDHRGVSSRLGRGAVDGIRQNANLGVGRILDIDVSTNGNEAPIQLLVQFQTQVISGEYIERLLVTGLGKETAKQRAIRFKAGELRGWRDVVMLDDVIKAERKLRREDAAAGGMFKRILDERTKSGFLSLLSLNPHVNQLNNIYVINQSSFDKMESELGSLEFDQARRDKMFEESGALFLVVINDRYETIRIFTHSLDGSTELTGRMVKQMGGKGDIDVMDIFKQFQNNNSLVF